MSEQLSIGPVLPSQEIDGFEAAFEHFWKAYPRRTNNPKHQARRAFDRALRWATLSEIMAGLARCNFSDDHTLRPMAATWLNQRRWESPDLDLAADGYGIEAWLRLMPRNGMLSAHAYEVEELRAVLVATGLPATWRGSLETLKRWMEDGYAPDSCARAVAAAVAELGTRNALVAFDKRVRDRALRTTGK